VTEQKYYAVIKGLTVKASYQQMP